MSKILFVCQPGSEYGQSIIYNGLRTLGNTVVDFPWNHTFHFTELKDCDGQCIHGPCTKNVIIGCNTHPAHMTHSSHVLQEHYDILVTNNGYGMESLYEDIYKKMPKIKTIVLDLGDSKETSYDIWCAILKKEPDAYFRREYIKGQKGYPLSYAFFEQRENFLTKDALIYDVSFIFRPTNPMRKELAQKLKLAFPKSYIGEAKYLDYLDITSRSKFAIAMPGAGEDTLRYWEIAGRGSVIVSPSQRNIIINNDFENNVNAIKFDNVEHLIETITHYLDNPTVYERLRLASWAHYKAYHTTACRALEMLSKIG